VGNFIPYILNNQPCVDAYSSHIVQKTSVNDPLARLLEFRPFQAGAVGTMIGLIQRVSEASVAVNGQIIGSIGPGLAALIGVQRDDGPEQAKRLAERMLAYRVFEDQDGKMNLDLKGINGGILLIPQFTLAANTGKGNRPSFTSAADPERARALFDELVAAAQSRWNAVETGEFGANMDVSLVNRGPVTFWLET
jgi:D-tyrosyl-tRNA(Tyr) deacylase